MHWKKIIVKKIGWTKIFFIYFWWIFFVMFFPRIVLMDDDQLYYFEFILFDVNFKIFVFHTQKDEQESDWTEESFSALFVIIYSELLAGFQGKIQFLLLRIDETTQRNAWNIPKYSLYVYFSNQKFPLDFNCPIFKSKKQW